MDMADVLTVFALLPLWLLEHFESGQVFRTMELKVGTSNIEQTHQVLRDLFERHGFTSELRHLQRATESDPAQIDRKSTRLNSSHLVISYAVFCLKKKRTQQ